MFRKNRVFYFYSALTKIDEELNSIDESKTNLEENKKRGCLNCLLF